MSRIAAASTSAIQKSPPAATGPPPMACTSSGGVAVSRPVFSSTGSMSVVDPKTASSAHASPPGAVPDRARLVVEGRDDRVAVAVAGIQPGEQLARRCQRRFPIRRVPGWPSALQRCGRRAALGGAGGRWRTRHAAFGHHGQHLGPGAAPRAPVERVEDGGGSLAAGRSARLSPRGLRGCAPAGSLRPQWGGQALGRRHAPRRDCPVGSSPSPIAHRHNPGMRHIRIPAVALTAAALMLAVSAAGAGDGPEDALRGPCRGAWSDGGSGTLEQPLCTITAVARAVAAGATVQVAGGTYSESVTVPASGTCTAPITFTARAGRDRDPDRRHRRPRGFVLAGHAAGRRSRASPSPRPGATASR
jgi:hypothetical protein